eukprot:m.41220 g.41220  ORF g.41220 m.41220 type:complete len:191 (+) comp6986_c0_seq1:43-615(+)
MEDSGMSKGQVVLKCVWFTHQEPAAVATQSKSIPCSLIKPYDIFLHKRDLPSTTAIISRIRLKDCGAQMSDERREKLAREKWIHQTAEENSEGDNGGETPLTEEEKMMEMLGLPTSFSANMKLEESYANEDEDRMEDDENPSKRSKQPSLRKRFRHTREWCNCDLVFGSRFFAKTVLVSLLSCMDIYIYF